MIIAFSLIAIALVVLAVALYKVYTKLQHLSRLVRMIFDLEDRDSDYIEYLLEETRILWVYILGKEVDDNDPHLLSIRKRKMEDIRDWVEFHEENDKEEEDD